MLAAALLGVPSVLAAARVMGRVGPGRLVPGLILASATLHALEFLAIERWPGPTAVLVYLHVSVGGALTISGFWSVVNERFDPHAARRAIAMVTGGQRSAVCAAACSDARSASSARRRCCCHWWRSEP